MRPLFIGYFLPFTAKPIRASRLKNINLRKFTYTHPLSMPVGLKKNYFAVTRSRNTHTLSCVWLGHTSGPVSWLFPPYFHLLHQRLSISLFKKFFLICPALVSIFFFFFYTGNAPHLLHKYDEKSKTLFVALPTPLPGHSGIVRPP